MSFVQGKVAIVTGGASGIGLCIVKELLKNKAKVAIVDISEENGTKAFNEIEAVFGHDKVIFLKADVTVQKDFEGVFEKTINKFKNLDIVVNNAGIANEIQFERTVDTNLCAVIRGTYLAMDKYLPKYKSGSEGVVVNIASVLGINSVESLPTYSATKHGIVGLGKSLGGKFNYERSKVRIITICPGVVNTPLLSSSSNLRHPDLFAEELKNSNLVIESPEFVAKGVIDAIDMGASGSAWVIESEEPPYEIVFPERSTLRKI